MQNSLHKITDINNIFYIYKKATVARLYGEQHYWLVLVKTLDYSVQVLNDSEYSISTDLAVAVVEDEKVVLYDAYNQCKYRGGLLNITLLGSWTNTSGLNITLTQPKFTRRSNFHGMNLRMAGLVGLNFKIHTHETHCDSLYQYNASSESINNKDLNLSVLL